MKMGKFIICAILIFALTNYAYGLGSGSHHRHHSNSGENGATFQDFNNTADGDSGPVPVPEPTTMLLLGSGLIGLAGYGRKKFFKK